MTRPVAGVVLLVLLGSLAPASAQKPSFTGHWKLDPTAVVTTGGGRGDMSGNASGGGGGGGGGTGLGPAADEQLIQQNDSAFSVEERRGDAAVILIYRLDGKRTRNFMPVGRGATTEATYSSKWDKNKLVTTINRTLSGRGTTTSMQYRETRYLAEDGAMVVETTLSGRPGGRTVVYRKVKE